MVSAGVAHGRIKDGFVWRRVWSVSLQKAAMWIISVETAMAGDPITGRRQRWLNVENHVSGVFLLRRRQLQQENGCVVGHWRTWVKMAGNGRFHCVFSPGTRTRKLRMSADGPVLNR